MTSITDAVASLEQDRSIFTTSLATAMAQGAQFGQVAAQTRAAQIEIDSAIARAKAEQIAADAATSRITAAINARTTVLQTVQTAKTGAGQPLSDSVANALKAAVLDANGGDQAKLDDAIDKVKTLDTDIATMAEDEASVLTAALDTLATKKADLVTKKAAALDLLAMIEGSAGILATQLSAAKDALTRATTLATTDGDAAHRAAIVAYVDYSRLRDGLAAGLANNGLGDDWATARDAWLSAAAAVAAAEEAVIEKRLDWARAVAEQTARLATRAVKAAEEAAGAF